ncbi:MAG TPA: mandelate racemase/muconate lactonizing enzyme family protein [Bryobacteraceae bacterium]|nr:mandelate racemase/muconate lactonizing enzyme family protein [Bryobacteraceae bacterium]
MPKPNRRRLLQYLATLGASAAGPALAAAAASPASVTGMRISRYELIPTHVPWDERVREMAILNWRRENMDVPHSPHTIVKIYPDEGLMGIGEGGSEAMLQRMIGHSPWEYFFNDTLGGAQTAIYDLLGKATGLPVCRLISPTPKKRIIQAYWSLSYPPDMLAREAKRGADQGYRVHKVKIRPWEDPVAQAHAIFSVVPRDYRVWGDANHYWGSVERTLHFATKLAEIPGYFGLESPLRNTEEYRQLRGKVPLRLAEHWGIVHPMLVAREAVLDANITASPTLGRTIFGQHSYASMYNIGLWDESSCWSGIGLAVQAHQAAAYPSIEYTVNAAVTAEDDLVKESFPMKDGFYDIPEKPGLGVTLDDDAVDKYRVR